MAENESIPRSLDRYVGVLRRQWWVITLVTVIAIAAAALYVARATPVYSASSKIVVGQGQTLFNPALSVNYTAFTSTISSLLESDVVADDAIKRLGLHKTATSLLSNLTVNAQPDGAVIQVSYNDTDKARAVRVLSTIGTVFTSLVDSKLASKTGGSAASQPVSAVVFDPAHPDPGQVSPHKLRSLVIALVLGLLAGVLLAFLRDALSSTVKSESDAEAAYGASSVGRIPRGALGVGIAQVGALPAKARIQITEAFQMLTTRLRYSTSLPHGVIVVASARPADGKSTVAAHIAANLAHSGKDVILVEADLHRPTLFRLVGIEDGNPGIADLTAEGGALMNMLIPIELDAPVALAVRPRGVSAVAGRFRSESERAPSRTENGDVTAPDAPVARGRLRLLPAGSQVDRARFGLSLGNVSSLITRLRALADYVVVDTPPLLLSGDAYPVIQLSDALLIVCRRGSTRFQEGVRAKEILHSLNVTEYSIVLSEAEPNEQDYYGYMPS
jgi:polysaccharide biosynthesis transport protein